MSSAPRGALVAALGAACLHAGVAAAQPVALPVVGLLTVTVTPAVALEVSGATGSGGFGASVVDTRTGELGYQVSVSTDGFDLVGPAVTSSPTTHIPSSAAVVAVTEATGGTASTSAPMSLPTTFDLLYPSAVGLLPVSSSYLMSLTVTIPEAAGPGLYSGTVTQSVV